MNTLKDTPKITIGSQKRTYVCDIKLKETFQVERDSIGLYVIPEETDPESASQILSSYLPQKLKFDTYELDRLPHHLVASLFSTIRERRMCDVLPACNDIWDNKTPDIFGGSWFLEIGTSILGSEYVFSMKMEGPSSYSNACRKRGVKLLVLGVGPSSVTSNFDLTDDEVFDICKAYLIGKKVQMSAAIVGFTSSEGSIDLIKEYDEVLECIDDTFDNLIPKSEHTISKETWTNWQNIKKKVWIYDTLINESIKEINKNISVKDTALDLAYEKDLNLVKEYTKSINSLPLRPPNHQKKLPISLAIVQEGLFDDQLAITSLDPIAQLWSSLLKGGIGYIKGKSFKECLLINYSVEGEEQIRLDPDHQERMKQINRIQLKVNESVLDELANEGLFAKSRKEKPQINTQSEFGFPIDDRLMTGDYENFLANAEDLFSKIDRPARSYRLSEKLLRSGGLKAGESKRFCDQFYNSKLGNALDFLSSVMSEINTCYKKPTRKKDFYVNIIPGYKAALAIHNTGSNKHSFYSVIIEKQGSEIPDYFSCFRDWVDIGDYYCTKISSTRRHDISHLLCASQSVLTIFASFFDVFSSRLDLNHKNRATKESLFFTLVFLENANQTSEFLQQLRFSYMKTNSSKLMSVPFLENIPKFPTIIRSRLAAFAIKSTISSFLYMSRNRTQRYATYDEDQVDSSQDNVDDLISFISKEKLLNYEEALALSYGGIYHNKDKANQMSSNLQIFVKMTKEELKLKAIESVTIGSTGDISPDEIPSHGFHQQHLNNCALKIIESLADKGISESDLNLKICNNLNKITYEEFATFKASLEMSHLDIGKWADIKYDPSNLKAKHGKTTRALEGVLFVLKKLESKTISPYKALPELIKLCVKIGGIVTALFKKNQIGGVREIFILTMVARIVIRFVESIARTIAEDCSNEFLTKGKDKINSTPSHYQRLRAEAGTLKTLSVFDSLDCQTWCQNFVFSAFGSCFSLLTRSWPSMSNAIRVIFNLATEKRHEMPCDLMDAFIKNPTIESFNESMNILKKEFLNDGGVLNNGFLSIMVKNKSNFMQGIFHYCSTILHSGHLMMMSEVMEKYVKKDSATVLRVVHTTKESSDDGSSLFSIILRKDDPQSIMRSRLRSLVASEILIKSYPFMCAKVSIEKSTRYVENGVEEFNSFWSYRNTVLSVPTKFAWAATLIKVTQSCIEKQRNDHNSLNDCLSNGLSMETCKVLEIAMAINHYESIGLSTIDEEVWSNLSNYIEMCSHPATWLYVISPEIIGTSLGFDYTLFNHLETSSNSRRTETVVMKHVSGTFDSKAGLLVQGSVYIGNDKRYRKFKKKVARREDIEKAYSVVDTNPSMLYRPSIDLDDVKSKITLKAISSGVSRAFSFEDSSAMMVVGSYINSSACLTLSIREEGEWIRRKMSLPAFLKTIFEMTTDVESRKVVDVHVKTIRDMISSYVYAPYYCGRRRKIPVKLKMPKVRASCEQSLLSVVKFLWFSIPNGSSFKENIHYLEDYKLEYDWLSASYSETLSNFEELGMDGNVHVNLKNVVTQEMDADKTISFLHTGRRTNTMLGTYLACLEFCQRKNCRLKRPTGLTSNTDLGECLNLENDIYPVVNFPEKIQEKLEGVMKDPIETIKSFKEKLCRPRTSREIRMLPIRYRKLLAITQLIDEVDQEVIRDSVMSLNGSYLLSFIVPQKQTEDKKWIGRGTIRVDMHGAIMILTLKDNLLLSISISNPSLITQYIDVLTSIIRKLKLETVEEKSHVCIVKTKKGAKFSSVKGTPVKQLSYHRDFKTFPIVNYEIKVEKGKCIKALISTEISGSTLYSDTISFYPTGSGMGQSRHCLKYEDALLMMMRQRIGTNLSKFVTESLRQRMIRLGFGEKSKLKKLLQTEIDDGLGKLPDDYEDFIMELSTVEEEMISAVANLPIVSDNLIDLVNETTIMEDALLLVETQNYNTFKPDYSDLILWDDLLFKLDNELTVKLNTLCTGNYTMEDYEPENKKLAREWRIIMKMRSLGLIPAPREFDEDEIESFEDIEEFESDDDNAE